MKLSKLGLKTKPETKYFAGGFVAFTTSNGELWYEVHYVKKEGTGLAWSDKVKSKEVLDQLLKLKTMNEAMSL